jgi:hypothetical protein
LIGGIKLGQLTSPQVQGFLDKLRQRSASVYLWCGRCWSA